MLFVRMLGGNFTTGFIFINRINLELGMHLFLLNLEIEKGSFSHGRLDE